MALLPIVKWPAAVLETKAKPVSEFNDEIKQFVDDMHETMNKERGIGMAANQVNRLLRVIVINIAHYDRPDENGEIEELKWWHNKRLTFINPEIVTKDGRERSVEGCLSFPEVYEWVDRAKHVIVRAQDVDGTSFDTDADGLLAVCVQHEIDHIDGIVFTSRMSRLKSAMVKKKMMKRRSQRENEA